MRNEIKEQKKDGKPKKKRKVIAVIGVIAVLAVGVTILKPKTSMKEPEIITESTLKKIVNISELSAYQCVYNDICTVMNKDKPDQVDYYCAYESIVDVGIDFSKVKVELQKTNIVVTIPQIDTIHTTVDIGSLDYIFVNKRANTETVSADAYKACKADAEAKVKQEKKIFELAEQNTENMIRALIEPFVEQVDIENNYEIHFTKEED